MGPCLYVSFLEITQNFVPNKSTLKDDKKNTSCLEATKYFD